MVECSLVRWGRGRPSSNGLDITSHGRMKANSGIRHAHPSAALHSERATCPVVDVGVAKQKTR